MMHETKTERLLTILRKLETDDLETQVRALKDLQGQPGFKAIRTNPAKKTGGILAALKEQVLRLRRLFSGSKLNRHRNDR